MDLPGSLDWVRGEEGAHLLAAPTAAALRAAGIEAYVAPIDPELADTAAFCEAYGVTMAESANCVVVQGSRGDITRTAAVMVRATDRADVNKTIRKHLDVRKLSFASRDFAVEATGMEYGGITPIGLPQEWPVLVDEAVATEGWYVIGSGIRGSKVAVRGTALGHLAHAEVLALTI